MIIIIKMTNRCNFSCVYCSVEGKKEFKDLEESVLYKFIDDLKEYLKENNKKECSILFHGGEPLLIYVEIYKKFINYIINKLEDVKIEFLIQTNGYLINDDFIKLFKEYNIIPGISLDGPKLIHDYTRILKNGNGTFDKVFENIKKLKENDIHSSVLLVLNKTMLDKSEEIFNFLNENKLDCKINPLSECGEAINKDELLLNKTDYGDFLINIFKLWINSNSEINIEPLKQIIQEILYGNKLRDCFFKGKCIENFIALNYDGFIYPCGNFSDAKILTYGSIKDNKLSYLLENKNISNKFLERINLIKENDCKNCSYFQWCNGGCPDISAKYDGMYEKTYFCESYKKLFNYILTDGLTLLKKILLTEKNKVVVRLKESKEIISRLNNEL